MPILLALLCWSATHAQNLDPIVPEGAVVRQLATGFRFTEGPAIDSAGNLYFTDLQRGEVNILAPDGTVTNLRTDEEARANNTLYVANDGHGGIRAYPLRADGTLDPGTDFAAMPGIVDGLALDARGNPAGTASKKPTNFDTPPPLPQIHGAT